MFTNSRSGNLHTFALRSLARSGVGRSSLTELNCCCSRAALLQGCLLSAALCRSAAGGWTGERRRRVRGRWTAPWTWSESGQVRARTRTTRSVLFFCLDYFVNSYRLSSWVCPKEDNVDHRGRATYLWAPGSTSNNLQLGSFASTVCDVPCSLVR